MCGRENGKRAPRLLVRDLLYPELRDPAKRGEAVRRLSHCFPPLYHVQWRGDKR